MMCIDNAVSFGFRPFLKAPAQIDSGLTVR
jgi:hypothetical protein